MFTADSWPEKSLQNGELVTAIIGNQAFALLSFQESKVVGKNVSGLAEVEQVLLRDGLGSRTWSGPALSCTFLPLGLHPMIPSCAHPHAHSHMHRLRSASVNAGKKISGRDDLILNISSVIGNQVFFLLF